MVTTSEEPEEPINGRPGSNPSRMTRLAVSGWPARTLTTIRQVSFAETALQDPGAARGVAPPMRSFATPPGSTTTLEPSPSQVIEAFEKVCLSTEEPVEVDRLIHS